MLLSITTCRFSSSSKYAWPPLECLTYMPSAVAQLEGSNKASSCHHDAAPQPSSRAYLTRDTCAVLPSVPFFMPHLLSNPLPPLPRSILLELNWSGQARNRMISIWDRKRGRGRRPRNRSDRHAIRISGSKHALKRTCGCSAAASGEMWLSLLTRLQPPSSTCTMTIGSRPDIDLRL